jgi:hypothetical protein
MVIVHSSLAMLFLALMGLMGLMGVYQQSLFCVRERGQAEQTQGRVDIEGLYATKHDKSLIQISAVLDIRCRFKPF